MGRKEVKSQQFPFKLLYSEDIRLHLPTRDAGKYIPLTKFSRHLKKTGGNGVLVGNFELGQLSCLGEINHLEQGAVPLILEFLSTSSHCIFFSSDSQQLVTYFLSVGFFRSSHFIYIEMYTVSSSVSSFSC